MTTEDLNLPATVAVIVADDGIVYGTGVASSESRAYDLAVHDFACNFVRPSEFGVILANVSNGYYVRDILRSMQERGHCKVVYHTIEPPIVRASE